MTPVLEVRDLTVRFGGVVAVDGVTMDVDAGEIVGLIGPNGAGKTTVLDALSGFVRHGGSVSVRGGVVDGLRPDRRVARGLARTFQSLELFEDLTVEENVAVAGRRPGAAQSATRALGLSGVCDRSAAALSPSERRLVALARALATEPSVLLLDEVAAGMDLAERAVLTRLLREVAATGPGIVLVDHDLGLVTDVCRRVVVLHRGSVIVSGAPEEVRRDERVKAAYLGRT